VGKEAAKKGGFRGGEGVAWGGTDCEKVLIKLAARACRAGKAMGGAGGSRSSPQTDKRLKKRKMSEGETEGGGNEVKSPFCTSLSI